MFSFAAGCSSSKFADSQMYPASQYTNLNEMPDTSLYTLYGFIWIKKQLGFWQKQKSYVIDV